MAKLAHLPFFYQGQEFVMFPNGWLDLSTNILIDDMNEMFSNLR